LRDKEDDPNDPAHPDHDLSEKAEWWYEVQGANEPEGKPWFLRRWVFLIIGILVTLSLIIPLLPR
jgi:hypothetical protein